MEYYRHKQVGQGMVVVLALIGVYLAVLGALIPDWPGRAALGMVLAAAAAIGGVFSQLTTIVTDETLIFHFGLGFWRKRIPFADLRRAAVVRNQFWWGFGIRLTPRGWLYNVWGLDAVEIERANGRTFRIGTDEPHRLADAINARLTSARH